MEFERHTSVTGWWVWKDTGNVYYHHSDPHLNMPEVFLHGKWLGYVPNRKGKEAEVNGKKYADILNKYMVEGNIKKCRRYWGYKKTKNGWYEHPALQRDLETAFGK